jgi:hypothetical protein
MAGTNDPWVPQPRKREPINDAMVPRTSSSSRDCCAPDSIAIMSDPGSTTPASLDDPQAGSRTSTRQRMRVFDIAGFEPGT